MSGRSWMTGLLAVACGAPGCSQPTQSEIKFLETREMDLPYEEAYRAAANGLFSLGYAIEHSDKESGIVTGKLSKKAAKTSVTFFLILPLPTISEGSNDEAVTFMVTPLGKKVTQLRMKVVRNGTPIIDRQLMTAIWQRIEREAMLDSKPAEGSGKAARTGPPGSPR